MSTTSRFSAARVPPFLSLRTYRLWRERQRKLAELRDLWNKYAVLDQRIALQTAELSRMPEPGER